MGPQDVMQRSLDSGVETVPPGVHRVQCNELRSTGERPVRRDHARQRRLSCAGATVYQDDGVGSRDVDDRIHDADDRALKSLRDRIVIS